MRHFARLAIDAMRRAEWLTADRAQSYSRVLSVALLIFLVAAYAKILQPALSDPDWRPMASDFDPFWSGARLALGGHPAAAYDGGAIRTQEAVGAQLANDTVLLYQYPPTFLLLCLPLALLPYVLALALFLGSSAAAAFLCLRQILPQRWAVLPIVVMPGAVINGVIGQNGMVSTAAFGGALLLLERSPVLAGACLGFFACKPHLAFCVPVALAAARRWTAFLACGGTALGLMAVSWLALGSAAWSGFVSTLWVSKAVLQSPQTGPKVITVYEAVRLVHGGIGLASLAQAAAGVICVAVVARVTMRRPGGTPEMATVVAAALLCTPYAMDYDLVCLSLPIAWVTGEALRTGWRDWEKIVLCTCYTLPLFARAVNVMTGVPVTPVILGALLCVVSARARTAGMVRATA